MKRPDDDKKLILSVDPIAFIREVEKIWQARDGAKAAAGYTEDAIVYYGQGQSHSGERLRNWPARWFEYARDLSITKTYRGHHGNCIAGTWVSRYTHPETGKQILERGAELFYLRGEKVYEHHMWQHSWPEDEVPEDAGFSTD
jgi:nuclear transport factor 2 (NTF2) superfamily protein